MTHGLSFEELAKFYDLSSDLFCIASIDGKTISVNKAFVKMLGFEKAFFYQTSLLTLIHPDDVSATQQTLRSLLNSKSIVRINNRFRTNAGQYLLLAWRIVYDPSSQRIYATARDLTDEFNAKNQHYQLQNALLEQTIISQTDRMGIITDVNEKFCHISGYAYDELVGQSHRIINSGMHSKHFFKLMWQTISKGEIWEGTITNRKKDGNLYYVRSIIVPMKNHNKEITHYVSIRQDITDSIVNQVELTKTLKILNETSAIAKVGGWELKVATGELFWTEETFKILEVEQRDGYSPTLPEGIQLYVAQHQPIIENAVYQAMHHGIPYELELLARTAKGNERWVFTNGKANYIDGSIYSISGTIQDIHDKKLAEQNLAIEKQRSIQNSKLASLGELAASIAHEINNPLGIISGSAQLLELERVNQQPDAVLQKAATILKSTQRIEHITQSLKRFARTSFDDMNSQTYVEKLLQEALSLTKPNIRRHLVNLEVSGSSQHLIRCNEIEIEQVFINLINNAVDAVKAQETRWIQIRVSDEHQHVAVEVVDSGHGIESSARDKLFQPFFTTKPKGEGTGLGLSICREICERHNAQLYLNEHSKHTCFALRFRALSESEE
ncbi:PAS domain-containing sensor histidine kinase [Pseudoalteromonas xiamenensis]